MCFPKLINQLQGSNFRQAKVLALSNTSDFDHNRAPAKVVREIYTKLSVSNALVPRAVGFRLDREGRTDAQMNELESETARNIRFLHRRNYECYLLHPVAVVAVLSTVKFEPDVDLSAARIEQCMSALGGKRELGAARYWNNDIKNPVWLKHVDGAKLLHLLFGEVTNQQLEYKKTTHSVALTEWLVANDREHIQELFDFVSW